MALPPSGTTDDGFLREVDEEYRRDRLLSIWRDYGRWIIGGVIAALAALALYLYLGHRASSAAGTQGEQFDAALRLAEENQPDKAIPEFDKIARQSGKGYAGLALITEGNLLLQKGDTKGATAKFAEVAGDASYPQPYRDLALLRQTSNEYDTLKPEQVIERLKGLAISTSPWFGTAGEMVAASYLKQGKRAEAGKLYGQIAQGGENVPESIRQRAVTLAGVLGVDAIDQSTGNTTR
ncbi:MAG: tetratricopeptide repeat protein [Sphingomonas sp.]|uniref:tetratricopeptide repeat protein n=1 Tax=Sphingomonas sp. TaxID=28214 RepID=UPI0025E4561E|nr:tetratricopeptide repeat protein [Sphingomonas sp.]MBX3563954.1 tetratricopeptide repeat protein [Sphingomonas sp.]